MAGVPPQPLVVGLGLLADERHRSGRDIACFHGVVGIGQAILGPEAPVKIPYRFSNLHSPALSSRK
jgi:hypothetical protein